VFQEDNWQKSCLKSRIGKWQGCGTYLGQKSKGKNDTYTVVDIFEYIKKRFIILTGTLEAFNKNTWGKNQGKY
jgi:hypothetical protein